VFSGTVGHGDAAEDHHELTDKGKAQHEAGAYRTLAASRRAGRIRSPAVRERSFADTFRWFGVSAGFGCTHAVSAAS
jgi:hypothetical protein